MGVPENVREALAARSGSERFQHEINFAARLQHPHILTVLDSGTAGEHEAGAGQLWFTMPFIEGESLRDRLRRESRLPLEDALRITTEAARALDYAHQHGVIHRDVKPENILLTRDGTTLVADFGIAARSALTMVSRGPGSLSEPLQDARKAQAAIGDAWIPAPEDSSQPVSRHVLRGWKDYQTLLTCYQQPDTVTMRAALERRMQLQG